ncbi:Major Facilitator Superfamily protein [Theileria parva strain Muguga]|uniref:Major facilitator superfamily (MFS) profile domain-containing protein n=1 Tax=Theileria parva TaxID=5875 RepID=Q4N016_THEPA|nr:Major Facilitator Superfamily protein [Theileria parva strain Muguga]EAN31073.1 Major Facilitator Superfamily protein [Theileria parva strain Muguga]|eukprot:XP_763356.1 hypothetical protein [Theileria parva strain Muguga]
MDGADFHSTTDPSSSDNNSDKISDIDQEDNVKSNVNGSRGYKYKLCAFVIIASLQVFVNYNIGAVPIMLNWIQEPYSFSSTELGIMGSLPFAGYLIFSPFVSNIVLTHSPKKSIEVGLFFNLVSLVIFVLSFNKYLFFISNFCIGASQSAFSTYCPIWVDTFAPKFHRNLWMSIIQGGIMIGMSVGYIVTSAYSFMGVRAWRYSIFTQILYGIILTILFYLIPKEYVNFDPSKDENVDFNLCGCEKSCSDIIEISTDKTNSLTSSSEDLSNGRDPLLKRYRSLDFVSKVSSIGMTNKYISRINSSFEGFSSKSEYSKCNKCFINNVKLYQEIMTVKKLSTWSKFKLLAKQNIFILTCTVMSVITFGSAGSLYWMTTIYLTQLKMSEKFVYFIFSLQVVTGMIFGTITGSNLIDQIIYHYPEHPLLVDITLIIYGIFAIISGIILIVLQIPIVYGSCIFILIFYTASIIPTIILQSVAYLPHRLKPAGSTFFICQYHIFGFSLGIIIPGIAMDMFNSYTAALCVIYLPGFIGLASLVSILWIKRNSIKKQ